MTTDALPDAALVVPAAGQGLRMGGAVAKQFRRLGGVPVLVWTLRAFDGHPAIGALVVAVPEAEVDGVRAVLAAAGLRTPVDVTAGGATRRDSVARALAAVPAGLDLVLVHDAVRPFVPRAVIDAVLQSTRADGAAAPALAVADTVRQSDGEWFGETVPREALRLVQTPQGFRRALLAAAHAAAPPDDATDDAALVMAMGHRVRLVPGDRRAFKLTTPDDWALAEALWAAECPGTEREMFDAG